MSQRFLFRRVIGCLTALSLCVSLTAQAAPHVINVADFGAKADAGADAGPAVRKALEAVAKLDGEPAILQFAPGRYDFFEASMPKEFYAVSATIPLKQKPNRLLTIGVWLKGLKHLTVEGDGALLMFHGRLTPFVIDGCEHIELRNFLVDFARPPTMSEFRIDAVKDGKVETTIHPDSKYRIANGLFQWVDENGKEIGWYNGGEKPVATSSLCQIYDPARDATIRTGCPVTAPAEEIRPGVVRFSGGGQVGAIYQMRDGMRDQHGAFTTRSRDIRWQDVNVHYSPGLGFITQLSENISMTKVRFEPAPRSGRTVSCSVDCMQFANCGGRVVVAGCRFVGAHDDAINIYGNQLRLEQVVTPRRLVLAFACDEQCGFNMLAPGDELDFLDLSSFDKKHAAKVISAKLIDPLHIEVELDGDTPSELKGCRVENRTWMPEVSIRDCFFSRVPTRAILCTSWRKTVIEHNTFFRTPMVAVLVNHGDPHWFLQGAVEDFTVRDNTFFECAGGVQLLPENSVVDPAKPVCRNVRIERNLFINMPWALWAKSTRGLVFAENRIATQDGNPQPAAFNGCTDVEVRDNLLLNPTGKARVAIANGDKDAINLLGQPNWTK
jgi:hypothetical protein